MTLSKTHRLALAAAALLAATAGHAAGLSYAVTDLADTTVGQDLWQIDYTVSGPLALFESVNVYFAQGVFSDIALLTNHAPAALDVAPPVQPDTGLGVDGFASFTALADHPAGTIGSVSMYFVWHGTGKPGTQPFDVQDAGFNVIANGQTVPAIPEPGAVWMMLAGLAAVGAHAARRRAR